MSRRGLLIAVVLEAAWAIFLAYEIHQHGADGGLGFFGGWQLELLSFMVEWATPAIAIVVVAWFVDRAIARLRG
jgi:hypothetical protein